MESQAPLLHSEVEFDYRYYMLLPLSLIFIYIYILYMMILNRFENNLTRILRLLQPKGSAKEGQREGYGGPFPSSAGPRWKDETLCEVPEFGCFELEESIQRMKTELK